MEWAKSKVLQHRLLHVLMNFPKTPITYDIPHREGVQQAANSHPDSMARWLDGGLAGSTARSMWLDGSMLTEDVFSLNALMPDSMPVLMPSSMLARCVARCLEAAPRGAQAATRESRVSSLTRASETFTKLFVGRCVLYMISRRGEVRSKPHPHALVHAVCAGGDWRAHTPH